MVVFEICCVLGVGLYWLLRIRDLGSPRRWAARLALVTFSYWAVDDLAQRFFGLYRYDQSFTYYLDQVPLVIVLVWPVLFHAAWDLSRHLLHPGHRALPFLCAWVVLGDVAILGPAAALGGLWKWQIDGLFGVSPLLPLVTALVAGGAAWVIMRVDCGELKLPQELWVLCTIPGALVASLVFWWGALRWTAEPLHPIGTVAVAWVLAAGISTWLLAERWRDMVPTDLLLARLPAVVAVMAFLLAHGGEAPLVVNYCFALVMCYAAITPPRRLIRRLQKTTITPLRKRLATPKRAPQRDAA